MTVYCLIPVHNRLEATKKVLQALEQQDFKNIVIVIDDGSTDGTSEYLQKYHPEVVLIKGDGNLWWTGAIAKGLDYVFNEAKNGDYVLLQNNDTYFAPDYISTLINVSQKYGDAVVGSPLKDIANPEKIFSLGPSIDYLRCRVSDVFEKIITGNKPIEPLLKHDAIEMDALSGRGTLYPVKILKKTKSVRYRLLPHYWADYELSVRAKNRGAKLLVALDAPVWTENDVSGISLSNSNLINVLFSKRSRVNIINAMVFYSLCGPFFMRVTAVPRVLIIKTLEMLGRRLKSLIQLALFSM